MEDVETNIKSDCAAQIFSIFPDICPEYFEKTATKHLYDVNKIIKEILRASSYPKKARPKSLKRIRESSEKEDEVSKIRRLYILDNRPPETAPVYISISKKVLCQDFPRATTKSVAKLLKEHNNCLMQTYLDLDEICRNWEGSKAKVGFNFKKTRTPPDLELEPVNLDSTLNSLPLSDMKKALEELRAARKVCAAELAKRNSVMAEILDEENNFRQAQEEGTIAECGCCFDERPLNRMVHCNNQDSEHCYVCSESCDYSHFDDSSRGGKKGNCPLFEKTEVRHEKEVRKAEEDARQKVMAANPELNEEHLKFNTSKRVPGKQEKTRKSA
ncbi:hypothetical protein COL154_013721 [Colletotrichum chrysophilum]|nr:hypothetical protein COL154_013721 [Colletotrichum chrysophilum]